MKIPTTLRRAALAAALLVVPVSTPATLAWAGPAAAPHPLAQDDEEKEKPDKRPEIEALVEELDDHVGEKGEKDAEAVLVIDKLVEEFPESGKRDRKKIVDALSDCLKEKRKPTKDGLLDNLLYEKASEALGTMGPESVKELQKWIGHKSFSKNPTVRAKMIVSLGRTREEAAAETLVDLLPNHVAEVQAAAAAGLSFFTHLDQKKRKDIFKEVLDEITRVRNIIDVDNVDPIERKRYDVISAPMIRTLQELSGNFEVRDPLKFRDWWNDHKHDKWEDLGGEGKKGD